MNNEIFKFLLVRFFSAMGDQFLLFAVPLIVYKSTQSIKMSGVAFFVEWLPRVISLPFAGIFSDKFGGRRVYFLADLLRAIFCLIGFSVITLMPAWTFCTVSILMGFCAFCYAQAFIAQEATIPTLIDLSQLHKAQSMVQTVEQSALVLGPLLASISCYILPIKNLLIVASIIFGISYVGMLFLNNFSKVSVAPKKQQVLLDLLIGIKIIVNNKKLMWLCVLTIIINLIWGLALATGAAFVTGIYGKSASMFGFIQTLVGTFSLILLLIIPIIINKTSVKFIGLCSYGLMIIGGLAVGFSANIPVFFVGYLLILAMDGVFNIYIRTERAKIIPKEHLGKTIGLIVLINQLSIPLSGLLVANFTNVIGVRNLFFIVSLLAIIFLVLQFLLSLYHVSINIDERMA